MAVDAAPTEQETPALAPRLRTVRVGLREDLEVTRHLFRGTPSYVVRDPITFQTQHLEQADYEVFVSIDTSRPLSEAFDDLVQQGKLEEEDEERFYQFIMSLHRIGFLQLPISDHKRLYRRFLTKERSKRMEKLMGFLFLRIPVFNPNAFLDRTIRFARPLFSWTAFAFWLVLISSAVAVAAGHWEQLAQPLEGLFAAQNLVVMWFMLIGLKVFHEFGHAYACKSRGGHVPEMGVYLIIFTPCAYMDASASWGFPRKRDRLLVCLAGVYLESIIASIAVFVWAFTGSSFAHSIAYNVIFLASVVTVLFNINPLMRYDGYYILSDLVEVPNLRARATKYVLAILKRVFLGVPIADPPEGWRLRIILVSFGIAATIYRLFLLLAIAAILASKLFLVGTVLAMAYLGSTVFKLLRGLTKYLWYAEETQLVRGRAVALSMIALVLTPAALTLFPAPSHVHARGVLTSENETIVRARTPGFLGQVTVECGEVVNEGTTLAVLTNEAYVEDVAVAQANLRVSDLRRDAYRVDEPDVSLQEADRAKAYQHALDQARIRIADLDVRAPGAGKVVECIRLTDVGSFLHQGDPIATIVSGAWQVRAILTDDDIVGSRPKVGEEVEFRPAAMPPRTIQGTIVRVAPAGSRAIELPTLTQLGGGDIAVNPATGEAAAPYFEIVVELLAVDAGSLRHGMTGTIRLGAQAEPIATAVSRRVIRFINRLMQEG